MTVFAPTEQQIAFAERPGAAFVVACPGAGKTRTIVARLARIALTLPPRKGVGIISFTNAAVEEFISRAHTEGLLTALRHPGFVGTFDGFLRQFFIAAGGFEGVAVRPHVLDSWRTINAEVRLNGANSYRGPGTVTLDDFDPETDRIDPARIRIAGLRQHVTAHRAAYEQRAAWLRRARRESGYISAADLRLEVRRLLRDAARATALGEALAARFHEIVVDEAQDCNPHDLEIINWLQGNGVAVTLVSDPDQAIYGFRRGDSRDLLRHQEPYAADHRLALTGNFRCAPAICALSATLRDRIAADDSCGDSADSAHPVHLIVYRDSPGGTVATCFSGIIAAAQITAQDSIVLSHKRKNAQRACGVQMPENTGISTVARLAKASGDYWSASASSRSRESAVVAVERLILELRDDITVTETPMRAVERLGIEYRPLRRWALELLSGLPQRCDDTDDERRGWIDTLLTKVEQLGLGCSDVRTVRQFFRQPPNGRWTGLLTADHAV